MSLVGWRYSKEIIIDNTGNDTSYENNLICINLTSNNFDFDKARFDGSDIRFVDSDGVTLLDYYIEDYDYINQKATIYVKVPLISANQSKSIYMWYGNMNAVSRSDESIITSGFLYDPDPFNDGSCLAFYPFDGDANDHSGNGYHGTWHGNEQYDKGIFGQCAKFDGGSYINIHIDSFPSVITLSFWFKQGVLDTSHSHAYFHFSKNDENTLMFWQNNNNKKMFFYTNNNPDAALPNKYEDNQWYHLVVISTGKVFVDGIQVLTINSVNMTQINRNFIIGADRDLGSINDYLQNGTCVDQVRIFNRALTESEIILLSQQLPYSFGIEQQHKSKLFGVACDKYGIPIVDKPVKVSILDKVGSMLITSTTTTTGHWKFNNFPADPGSKVLVVYSLEGQYHDDNDIAGATFNETI